MAATFFTYQADQPKPTNIPWRTIMVFRLTSPLLHRLHLEKNLVENYVIALLVYLLVAMIILRVLGDRAYWSFGDWMYKYSGDIDHYWGGGVSPVI